MSGYETAPGTELVATHCACCGKPLLDSESVERGTGPECAKKYGIPATISDKVRDEANKLIYKIAIDQDGPDVDKWIKRLVAIGCDKLAKRIKARVYGKKSVVIENFAEGRISVVSPWNDDFVYGVKRIRGRRWDGENKFNHFPACKGDEVLRLICECYPGKLLVTAKGEFPIRDMLDYEKVVGELPEDKEKMKPVECVIKRGGKRFAITTPYDPGLVAEMRSVVGRRWNREHRVNTFPVEMEDDVCEMVSRYFPRATFQTQVGGER